MCACVCVAAYPVRLRYENNECLTLQAPLIRESNRDPNDAWGPMRYGMVFAIRPAFWTSEWWITSQDGDSRLRPRAQAGCSDWQTNWQVDSWPNCPDGQFTIEGKGRAFDDYVRIGDTVLIKWLKQGTWVYSRSDGVWASGTKQCNAPWDAGGDCVGNYFEIKHPSLPPGHIVGHDEAVQFYSPWRETYTAGSAYVALINNFLQFSNKDSPDTMFRMFSRTLSAAYCLLSQMGVYCMPRFGNVGSWHPDVMSYYSSNPRWNFPSATYTAWSELNVDMSPLFDNPRNPSWLALADYCSETCDCVPQNPYAPTNAEFSAYIAQACANKVGRPGKSFDHATRYVTVRCDYKDSMQVWEQISPDQSGSALLRHFVTGTILFPWVWNAGVQNGNTWTSVPGGKAALRQQWMERKVYWPFKVVTAPGDALSLTVGVYQGEGKWETHHLAGANSGNTIDMRKMSYDPAAYGVWRQDRNRQMRAHTSRRTLADAVGALLTCVVVLFSALC